MCNHDQISSLRFALNVWHDASMLMSGVTPIPVEKPECRGSCTGVTAPAVTEATAIASLDAEFTFLYLKQLC